MSNPSSNTNQPRLLSFTLDGSDVLGAEVTVTLTDGVAVLVGRNGVGKSAIIEGFEAISSIIIGKLKLNQISKSNEESIPKKLEIKIVTPSYRQLEYKYELVTIDSSEDTSFKDLTSNNLDEGRFSWDDCCQYIDGEQEILWTTKDGKTTLADTQTVLFFGGVSSLGRLHPEEVHASFPVEQSWISLVLSNIYTLKNNLIRTTSWRRISNPLVSGKRISSGSYELADRLSFKIIRLMQTEGLTELQSVCRRVGLGKYIIIDKYSHGINHDDKDRYFASVLLDEINLGLLSEGTLRVLSILIEIIASHPSATIMIEEPEMQIHPGMLAKLLNEIETYTFGKNLIISTHSPQVVAWTSPDKVNLAHRNNGKTFIQRLDPDEIHRVYEYLAEEGDLGEWLYSGILDE